MKYKLGPRKPAHPLVVVLFKDELQMLARSGNDQGQSGYYSPANNRIHAYMWKGAHEPSRIARMRCEQTIAHEGVHQLLFNMGIHQRLSKPPIWFVEGLAEYLVPGSFSDRGKAANVNSIRSNELFAVGATRSRSGISRWQLSEFGTGRVVVRLVTANDLDSYGYALAWTLTHYLATEKPQAFIGYLREQMKRRPMEPMDPRAELVRYTKFFGDDLATLEERLVNHARVLKKQREEAVRIVMGVGNGRILSSIVTFQETESVVKSAMAKQLGLPENSVRFSVREYPDMDTANAVMLKLTSRIEVAKPALP